MADGEAREETMLTFLIPIRHPATVADWNAVKLRLAETVASVAAQTADNWRLVLVANRGADLPALPEKAEVVWVDLAPPPPLPERPTDEDRYNHVRPDKGRRVLLGLMAVRPGGFVMTVDYDDFVSNRLAELVRSKPGANGWYVDEGYVYDAGPVVMRYPKNFHEYCGTCLIVRADLLDVPENEADADDDYVRLQLGSHKFLPTALARKGFALERVPFPGAMYRIGYRGTVTGSRGIRDSFFRRWELRRNPGLYVRRFLRLRWLTRALLDGFFGSNYGERAA